MRQIHPFSAALAAMLWVAAPAAAQQEPALQHELDKVRQAIVDDEGRITHLGGRAAELAGELDVIRTGMIEAATKIQPIEAEIAALKTRIADLSAAAEASEVELAEQRRAMVGTLAALQRMALRPPASLLVSPGDANDIVRTGLLLRSAVPLLEDQAASLRTEMNALAALKAELGGQRQALIAARHNLEAERDKLAALARGKAELLAGIGVAQTNTQSQIDEGLARAANLEELIGELRRRASERAATQGRVGDGDVFRLLRPLAQADGQMATPAQGRIVHTFGDANAFGGTHKGVTFVTAPGAQIFAPWDGKVAFAGPFQSFGLILIIDHGQEYHSLIAGFSEISAIVDQWVLAGEPIGTTPADTGNGTDNSDAGRDGSPTGLASGPTLYVELREGGLPINPLPWLAARNDKVEG
ncbi:MAG: peptidoglycan DD-metalloendopeptidase family protein [Alphaproteobacteria bacterium]|nr:peptidoglycan DD-metalloendopeptidase family protein [Alphaproteobacteria bacterium]